MGDIRVVGVSAARNYQGFWEFIVIFTAARRRPIYHRKQRQPEKNADTQPASSTRRAAVGGPAGSLTRILSLSIANVSTGTLSNDSACAAAAAADADSAAAVALVVSSPPPPLAGAKRCNASEAWILTSQGSTFGG